MPGKGQEAHPDKKTCIRGRFRVNTVIIENKSTVMEALWEIRFEFAFRARQSTLFSY